MQGVLKRNTLIFGAPGQEAWQEISELPALLQALAPASAAAAPPPVPSRGGSTARKPSVTESSKPSPAAQPQRPAAGGLLAEIQSGKSLRKAKTADKSKPRTGGGGVVEGTNVSRGRTASVSATGGKAGVTAPSPRMQPGGGMQIGGGGLNGELAAKLAKRRARLQASSTPSASGTPSATTSGRLNTPAAQASAAVKVVNRPDFKAPSPGKVDSGIAPAAAAAAAGTQPASPVEVPPLAPAAPPPPPRTGHGERGGGHARRSSDDMAVGTHSDAFEAIAQQVSRPGGGNAPDAPPRKASSGSSRGKAAGEAPPPLAPKPKARRASAFAGSSSNAASSLAAVLGGKAAPGGAASGAGGGSAAAKKKRLGGASQSISVGDADAAAPFGISDAPPDGSSAAGSKGGPTHNSPDAAWVSRHTADGKEYYHNTASGELTWDKPRCLQSAEEKEVSQAEWTWVQHPQRAWLPAKITGKSGSKVTVVTKDGLKQTISSKDSPMWPLHLPSLKRIAEVQDLVQLRQLNEATM